MLGSSCASAPKGNESAESQRSRARRQNRNHEEVNRGLIGKISTEHLSRMKIESV